MLIFEEHFQDNRHNWSTQDSEECSLRLLSNCYVFEHKRPNSYYLTWNSADFFYDKEKFHIHVVLEKLTYGSSNFYGFAWGISDPSNFYEFVIIDNGCYRISKYENGKRQDYSVCKYTYGIQDRNTINLLEIRRNLEFVEFYINSRLVEKLAADKIMQVLDGKFGFAIYKQNKIKVHSLLISTTSIETTGYDGVKKSDTATNASFFKHSPPPNDTLDKVFADLKALVGLNSIKQQFFSLANFLSVQTERKRRGLKTANTSLHLVLYGPPGTGKTTIARLVGRLYKQIGCLQQGHVVETDRAGIVGGYIGQTALRVADAVDEAIDGVLFIDEAYTLAAKDGFSNDYGHEAVQVLLKRMEDNRDRLAVIVAGYADEMEHFIASNPGLQSRFNRLFYFDHYTPNDLVLIFAKFCHDSGYTIDISARITLQTIFETAYDQRNKNFGNGRFARTVFEGSLEQQANRIANNLHKMDNEAISLITAEDLGRLKDEV